MLKIYNKMRSKSNNYIYEKYDNKEMKIYNQLISKTVNYIYEKYDNKEMKIIYGIDKNDNKIKYL